MDIERIWNLVKDRKTINENGCWLYTGNIDPTTGYGRYQLEGVRVVVHRISCAIHHGLNYNDNSEMACHTCQNRHCFNPDHVYKGDNVSNQLDVLNGKCKNGHDMKIWGARNGSRSTKKFCRLCRKLRLRKQSANLVGV